MFARIGVPVLAGQYIDLDTGWMDENLELRLLDMT